jgi:UDP-N-acetylglucosamine acyltransferase
LVRIHPSSIVEAGAEIDEDVEIGPFCYVKAGAKIGAGTKLDSHVTILDLTTIGRRNFFSQGTVMGGIPQDRKFKGEESFLVIGDDNVFRDYVTVHRGTGEGQVTTIGHRNYIMAFTHVGHNSTLMDDITIANSCGIAGHVTMENKVTVGGLSGIHQFVRCGELSMVGGMTKITRDVPPFMIADGIDQKVHDINAVGLRRNGISQPSRLALHKACKLLFKSQIALTAAIEIVRREVPATPEVEQLLAFMERIKFGKNGRGDQK